MIDNKWFCEPDDQRDSWCFLVLQLEERDFVINGWEIGYGNPRKLIRIISSSKSSEKEIIKELLQEIYYCRRKGIQVITFGTDVLPVLRTRIILLDLKDVSLRGVKHICIEKIIKEYFLLYGFNTSISNMLEIARKMNIEMKDLSRVELLHNLFLRIGPMLPDEVI